MLVGVKPDFLGVAASVKTDRATCRSLGALEDCFNSRVPEFT